MTDNPPNDLPSDTQSPWQAAILQGTHDYYSELGHEGVLRPAWKAFFDHLPDHGSNTMLGNKWRALQRQIVENGITYSVYSDPKKGPSRPWMLDLLPFIIESEDWAILQQAVTQRATLLNALMADVYGPQRVFREGLLPVDLVAGHPGYLPQLNGVKPTNGVWLHHLAFDFGRSPDGRWWLISHRVQAPSGLGYSLENRLCISRHFRQAFRELGVQHLGRFFRDYLTALAQLSPRKENARIAILTPGPYNETYFEHTYLARYLGITLVEGSDLIVRQNKLFLRTVQGLEQIDVLIRRTDDQWLDPLELRADSQLGVAGLLQAVRNNGVVMANMPGGGWLEGPALHGFMPSLADAFLSQELLVPSVPSWWCGEQAAWKKASQRLENLMIRSTYPQAYGNYMEPVMGSVLSKSGRAKWLSKIDETPSHHTLQELIPLSRAPIWTRQGLDERTMMLRLYAVTDGQGGYAVMPGGLTRVASSKHGLVSMQRGGSSLDTWVRQEGPIDTTPPLSGKLQAEHLAELKRPVSSRAAEHLFWLGRYTDRASFALRLLTKTQSLLSENEWLDSTNLYFLNELCALQQLCSPNNPSTQKTQNELEQELIVRFTCGHTEPNTPPMGLAGSLVALSDMAGHLRERLSNGHWRLLKDLRDFLNPKAMAKEFSGNLDKAFEKLRLYLMALYGEQSDHMTRDTGWRFLQLGRQIERLANACDVLLALTEDAKRTNESCLSVAVALGDCTITYRSRYQHRFEWLPTLDLLVFDEDMPYSLKRILYKLDVALQQLPGDCIALRAYFTHQGQSGSIPSALSLHSLQAPIQPEVLSTLRQWLLDLRQMANALSDLTGAQYFRLSESPDHIIQER